MPAITTLPAIGAPLAGGFFAGIYLENGAPFALIVAPKAEGEAEDLEWGPSVETAARSLIDGLANSEAINDHHQPAARFCRGLRIGGFDDWHLPALDQMSVPMIKLRGNHVPKNHLRRKADDQTTVERTGSGSGPRPPEFRQDLGGAESRLTSDK